MMVSRTSEGGLSFLMRTAHHVGWRSAHPSLSDKVKQSIVDALNLIHVKGVLHGDIALRHILVGELVYLGTLSLINYFQMTRIMSPSSISRRLVQLKITPEWVWNAAPKKTRS